VVPTVVLGGNWGSVDDNSKYATRVLPYAGMPYEYRSAPCPGGAQYLMVAPMRGRSHWQWSPVGIVGNVGIALYVSYVGYLHVADPIRVSAWMEWEL
jgi:hypothetical protein